MYNKLINNILLFRYILIIIFVISFLWLCKALILPGYPDFQVHYFGAEHLIHRENPYLPDKRYFTGQVYPPFDMVFAIPLTIFSFQVASKVWTVISLLAIVLSIYFSSKIYKVSFFSNINLLISSLVFISFPLKFTLGMGQINTIILLFVVGTVYCINKKKEFYAGILLTFSVVIKFFPILFLPYFVYLKKWKLLCGFIFLFLILNLITFLFFTPAVIINFFVHILPDLLSSWKGDYYNQALTGLLMRTISNVELRNYLRIIISLILLFITIIPILLKRKKSIERINLEIASLLILSVLINSFSWQHHFIFLTLPFIIVFFTGYKRKNNKYFYCLILLSYLLIATNLKNPEVVPLLLQSHIFFGGLLLWIMSIYMLIKYKI